MPCHDHLALPTQTLCRAAERASPPWRLRAGRTPTLTLALALALTPHLLAASAQIAVMGGDQAAGVLSQVRVAGAKRAGTPLSEEQAAEYHEQLRSR